MRAQSNTCGLFMITSSKMKASFMTLLVALLDIIDAKIALHNPAPCFQAV